MFIVSSSLKNLLHSRQ